MLLLASSFSYHVRYCGLIPHLYPFQAYPFQKWSWLHACYPIQSSHPNNVNCRPMFSQKFYRKCMLFRFTSIHEWINFNWETFLFHYGHFQPEIIELSHIHDTASKFKPQSFSHQLHHIMTIAFCFCFCFVFFRNMAKVIHRFNPTITAVSLHAGVPRSGVLILSFLKCTL